MLEKNGGTISLYLKALLFFIVATVWFDTSDAQMTSKNPISAQNKHISIRIEPARVKLSDYYPSIFKIDTLDQSDHKVEPLNAPPIDYDLPNPKADYLKNFKLPEGQQKETIEKLVSEHNSLLETICQVLEKTLINYSIFFADDNPDIILAVGIEKIAHLAYSDKPIIEKVSLSGKDNSGQLLFNIKFTQHKDYIDLKFWQGIKTTEQIGAILANKILKEIKRLQANG